LPHVRAARRAVLTLMPSSRATALQEAPESRRRVTLGISCLATLDANVARTMYPDFLFFHQIDGDISVDLVDPHRPSQADTGPKWAGLAEYANKHGASFRRVIAVIKNLDDVLVSLDLKNPSVAAAMQVAATETDIRRAFEELGGNY